METAVSNNVTTHHGWMSSPGTRGTSEVLYPCIATITLCVYTAVHLNIPEPGEKRRWHSLRQAKWTLIAIFAPEFVLFTALAQYREAAALVQKLSDLKPKKKDDIESAGSVDRPPATWRKRWLPIFGKQKTTDKYTSFDMAYGFYAVMGGFRVNVQQFSDTMSTAALSPPAIVTLAEHGVFCDIERSTIQDKSKANSLAKGLVVLQVSWMVVQCVGRKTSGLPLTLLEIHTFVHAICAAMMYALWFKKPFSIGEATTISVPPALSPVVAEMTLISRFDVVRLLVTEPSGNGKARIHITAANMQNCEYHELPEEFARLDVSFDTAKTLTRENQFRPYLYFYTPDRTPPCPGSTVFWMSPFPQYVVEVPFTLKERRSIFCAYIEPRGGDPKSRAPTLAEHGFPGFVGRRRVNIGSDNTLSSTGLGRPTMRAILGDISQIFLSDFGYHSVRFTVLAMVAQAAYGGIHLAAWDSTFPNRIEELLWRASCLIVMTFMPTLALTDPILFAISLGIAKLKNKLDTTRLVTSQRCRKRTGLLRWCSDAVKGLLRLVILPGLMIFTFLLFFVALVIWAVLPLAMVAARMFVVTESFASLRVVPLSVYSAVSWAAYIPHV